MIFEKILIEYTSILLPCILLVVSVTQKLLIDRSCSLPDFLKVLIELPVEMKFLAIGFFASYSIAPQGDSSLGLLLVVFFLLTAMLTTFLARRSKGFFEMSHHLKWIFLTTLNFLYSIFVLAYSVSKVKGMTL